MNPTLISSMTLPFSFVICHPNEICFFPYYYPEEGTSNVLGYVFLSVLGMFPSCCTPLAVHRGTAIGLLKNVRYDDAVLCRAAGPAPEEGRPLSD
jgi:hypothetical protein